MSSDPGAGERRGVYDHAAIEKKWQAYWIEHRTFRAVDFDERPKYYILDMFPYPSGDGLHVGHPEGYTATDIFSRYKRMCGFNVLHPIGWDAFGLPAEQYAVKTGTHPRDTTDRNIRRFREQIQSLGFSYDWEREVDTTDVDYYRWTQWIFLKLFEKGLAYESFEPVNWCPELGTVLANEEVQDGKSEVGGYPVIKKPVRQWVLKITDYADRLLEDLDGLDWPETIKQQQRNWIGRSEGADIVFTIDGREQLQFTVYSTRPDTVFGATFVVLAPEHPLVEMITSDEQRELVSAYVTEAGKKAERERLASTEKSGVFTGAYAINPVNEERIPIWIADYVLASYGHGAIMAVPGHDERDHAFARQFGLGIVRVIDGPGDIREAAHVADDPMVNSGFLDGMRRDEAVPAIARWLEDRGQGRAMVNYKLRDWLFSRQRYWGEPIPMAHDKDGNVVTITEEELPVVLPDLEHFKPTGDGESPLGRATGWLDYERDGKVLRRETNTMPQWAGSCWYYLRYLDPRNTERAWDEDKEKYWMPVDLYVGGAEHAVLHLLYARFWHKVLFDLGFVSTSEPFTRLVNQGMILGENGEKMSKSRGNVVNPDDIISAWGADSMRLYEMFMGPLEVTKPWQTNGITGMSRFLNRVWRLFIDEESGAIASVVGGEDSAGLQRVLHKTIRKVTEDTDGLRFNTAISAMIEFTNAAYKEPAISRDTVERFVKMLSAYAPHLCEEVWERLGHSDTLAWETWPVYDPELVREDMITVSVQVNGKLRGSVEVEASAAEDVVLTAARDQENVRKYLDGKQIRKEVYVPGRIVNFVVAG